MQTQNPVVATLSGPVKGLIKQTDTSKRYFSFQGIPYAEPLHGEFRFKAPRPVKKWSETLDATRESDISYQFDIWRPDPMLTGGDNCLNLNIYTPNIEPATSLPVFVWIHGGGFVFGSGSSQVYGPDYLVERDVVVVTVNYRLNIFGFLSLRDPKVGVPGNAGLKDQTMALRWIKENVACFGGDPNNVTIAGESAGGASINYHLISPFSKGLFTRAIMMSGSVFNPWAQAPINYKDFLKRLAVHLEIDENSSDSALFEAIVKTDPIKLVQIDLQLAEEEEKFFGSVLLSGFLPQVEPYASESCFLPSSVEILSRNPWSKDLDVILGGCADEGLLFYYELPSDSQFSQMNEDFSLFLTPDLRAKVSSREAHHRGSILKKLYFAEERLTLKNVPKFIDFQGDKQFWFGIYSTLRFRLAAAGKGKTFFYRLNVPPSKDTPDFYEFVRTFSNVPHRNGTCHSEDIPFLFKAAFAKRFAPNDDNYVAAQRFLTTFVDFVNNGKPSDAWRETSKKSIKCLDMGQRDWRMTTLPNIDKLRVWEAVYSETKAKY
ncbi:esterase B1-like [Culicoides brevitarsis]|uniref:esterase B1-like n=1 Tax=Culicoides brevitarsis TaxID=469753 RepID=UPI00307C635D